MIRIIQIEENPELIQEANELLLRTHTSDDISDNREIDALIGKILRYIQDAELPILSQIKNKYEVNFEPIQIIFRRQTTDEVVKKLFKRQEEIRERYKMSIYEIYIHPNSIKMHFDDN